jgi:ADP-ribose pyrophosphatase YjhB (NUDIX family)
MPVLPEDTVIETVVADIIYCGVIVKAINDKGEFYYFSIEKYPQNTKQNTKPVDDTGATEEYPERRNVNHGEALDYWTANIEKNADGTRKGGAFAKANFSLKDIPIGATLNVEILKNTDYNTTVMVRHGDAEPFEAYACAKPSPQYAVDTYIMCFYKGQTYIRLIQRAKAGPDYPNARAIPGGFLNGGMTVDQGRAAELQEEGGIIIGNNVVKVIELGERNAPGREPRYMPFTYRNAAGELITFGCERGSTANAVIHFVINKDGKLPRLAPGTDEDEVEVVKGEWVLVNEFLSWSNDPASDDYVAWMDHQDGARAGIEKLEMLRLVA